MVQCSPHGCACRPYILDRFAITTLQVGNDQFCDVLMKIRGPDGPEAVRQWQHLQVIQPTLQPTFECNVLVCKQVCPDILQACSMLLQEAMRPLAKAATMLPPTAFRFDPGAAITVLARYLPQIVTGGADGLKLLGSFKKARTAFCARIMPSRIGPTFACADGQM